MSNSWAGREDKVGLIKALLPITHKRLALGPAGEEAELWLLPEGPQRDPSTPQPPASPRAAGLGGHGSCGKSD